MRILIIGDAPSNKRLSEQLTLANYQSDSAENFKDGAYFVDIRNYDVVLVDWALVGIDVEELISIIKGKNPRTIIFALSVRGDKNSEIKALNMGADDFLKIPYDIDVLIARVKAHLRLEGGNTIIVGDLQIKPAEEKVFYKSHQIDLKGKPFDVMVHLARHANCVVSKEQLLDAIWEEPELVTPNVIEVAINQIRQKIDKHLGISTVETVRRKGYRLNG